MRSTTPSATRFIRLLLPVALLLGAGAGARAQTPACEQFKGVLATRLRLDAERFTLEAVPAGTALAPGAKVVGTCGGGAYKILQLRKGETAPQAATAVRPAPASVPASTPAPAVASRPAATVAQTPVVVASAAPVVAAEPVAKPPVPEAADAPAATSSAPEPPSPGFITEYGRWLLLLVALPLAAWGWRWFTHGRFYDSNGLPRGPKF